MKKLLWSLAAASVLLAAACSNPAASASSGTPAYVKGVVSAKGSVWVNGVEYQTAGSAVSVDGSAKADSDLKVGMTVELRAVYDPATGQWKAQQVDYESELRGLVTAVDTAASTFTVFGLGSAGTTVQVDSTTVFEGATDLGTLAQNDFVEVSGTADSAGTILATRVEVKALPTSLKISAVLSSDVTTTDGGGSFEVTYKRVGTFTVTYTGTLDPAIVKGSRVRITFALADVDLAAQTLTVPAGQIQLRTTEPRSRHGDHSEYHGVISELDASGDPVTFTLDSQKVTATLGVLGAYTPANGDRIEVEGTIGTDGVLVAAQIHRDRTEGELSETKGSVTAVDTAASTFTVRTATPEDITFTVTASTIYHGDNWFGTDPLAKLTVGAVVEVKSYTDTSVSPNVEVAVKVESGDSDEAHHHSRR